MIRPADPGEQEYRQIKRLSLLQETPATTDECATDQPRRPSVAGFMVSYSRMLTGLELAVRRGLEDNQIGQQGAWYRSHDFWVKLSTTFMLKFAHGPSERTWRLVGAI